MTHEHIVVVRLNRIASLLIGGEHDMDGWWVGWLLDERLISAEADGIS